MARGSALDQCERIRIDKATETPEKNGTYHLYADRWWQVVDGCILLFRGFAPQCNAKRDIAERIAGEVGEVEFLKRVWLPARPEDFR